MLSQLRPPLPIVLCLLLTACAGDGSKVAAGSINVVGDENGGKIAEALGPAQAQAMQLVTSHCAKYNKKGFVTRMDYESGTLAFECRRQSAQAKLSGHRG
jgi:hypothetical protein